MNVALPLALRPSNHVDKTLVGLKQLHAMAHRGGLVAHNTDTGSSGNRDDSSAVLVVAGERHTVRGRRNAPDNRRDDPGSTCGPQLRIAGKTAVDDRFSTDESELR
jgi:hypothetical protein